MGKKVNLTFGKNSFSHVIFSGKLGQNGSIYDPPFFSKYFC